MVLLSRVHCLDGLELGNPFKNPLQTMYKQVFILEVPERKDKGPDQACVLKTGAPRAALYGSRRARKQLGLDGVGDAWAQRLGANSQAKHFGNYEKQQFWRRV